jgi:hypothetical protein
MLVDMKPSIDGRSMLASGQHLILTIMQHVPANEQAQQSMIRLATRAAGGVGTTSSFEFRICASVALI